MAAAYSSRDIVEDYLRYKLLNNGVAWRVPPRRRSPGGQRSHSQAASTSWLSWRSEGARTSHQGVTPEGSQQDPCLAPPRLQVVLRCAGNELERCYRGDLSAHVSVLLQHDGGGQVRLRDLTAVREELFRDGVNWGRIVAMMELGGALCTEVVKTGGMRQVDDIAGWMEESLDSPPLRGWIEDNGGWDAFVELYGESRPPVSFWSLRTVFGLAVLGAAGITLGALFTQR
ncbi:apoptosis regulator Bcl-2-like [Siniperca chuatsi]|uniref:apoptosis regulator Bcl-2-like n=1 Tax=Siniperca chuatsi TaxID=119488 RepID=UPI001CE09291|nr:apoptosis regulator Bcl-2-like [Siniperca chuatsi]